MNNFNFKELYSKRVNNFIELFNEINRTSEVGLTLKIEKSKYREWEVKVYELGYDMPILEVRDVYEKVFINAYRGLYLYMRYGKEVLM